MKTRATMKSMVTRPVNPQANNAEVNKSGEGTVKGAGNELHPFVDCFALLGLKGWESTWLDCLIISSLFPVVANLNDWQWSNLSPCGIHMQLMTWVRSAS